MKTYELFQLEEGSEDLESMGLQLISARLKAGEKVYVKKETVLSLRPNAGLRVHQGNSTRSYMWEDVQWNDDGSCSAVWLGPSRTAYWETLSKKLTPEEQEGWMMQRMRGGWISWREV